MPSIRSFVQFEGEGDTANARPRAIGGHAAVVLTGACLRKDPKSLYANKDGYIPFGTLVNYSRRPQQRLHQLVAVGRWANHPDDEAADDALYLS